MALRKFADKRILVRQEMRDSVLGRTRDLFHGFAGIGPADRRVLHEREILRLYQRIREIDRIGHYADMGHEVAVPDKVFHRGGTVALRQTVAPHKTLLEVRGIYGKDGSFPLSRRKTHPGVRGVFGGMRAS